jgi:hypothetical protein
MKISCVRLLPYDVIYTSTTKLTGKKNGRPRGSCVAGLGNNILAVSQTGAFVFAGHVSQGRIPEAYRRHHSDGDVRASYCRHASLQRRKAGW